MSKRLAVLGCLGALGLALGASDCLFDYAGAERCANGTGGGCPDATTSASSSMTSSSSSMPLSCQDQKQDGEETDKDCGGDAGCPRCAQGKKCKTGSDCDSAVCAAGTCAPINYTGVWKAVSGSPQPPPRFGAGVAALDGGTMLVYGGHDVPDATTYLDDTWQFGDHWDAGVSGPARVYHAAMAFDADRGKSMLAGGITHGGTVEGTTFWYDASAGWADGPALPGGETLHGASLVYAPDATELILFGGLLSGATPTGLIRLLPKGATSWTTDNPTSMEMNVSTRLPRYYHAAVYATKTTMIVFGGSQAETVVGTLHDTWALDTVEDVWKHLTDDGPSPRYGAAMAYDSHRGVTVLFGGANHEDSGHSLGDTWEFDGKTWKPIPATLPSSAPKRVFAAMAYDEVRQRVVLFSGGEGVHPVGGTFEYIAYGEPCPDGKCVNDIACVDGVCCSSSACSGQDRCNTPASPGVCADPNAGM